MSTQADLRIPCHCSQCSKAPNGYIYQTRQLIHKHTQNDHKQLALRPVPRPTERTTQDQDVMVQLDDPVNANANPTSKPAEPFENDPSDDKDYDGPFYDGDE
jgi:hypothetical protein